METEQIVSWLKDKAARADGHDYRRMLTMAATRLEELTAELLRHERLGDTYDLDHLLELMDAEKEGRLVVLPCKEGDTIYQVIQKCPGGSVYECPYSGGRGWYRCANEGCDAYIAEVPFSLLWYNNLGKDMFATKEEAEAALAKDNNVPSKNATDTNVGSKEED